MVTKAAVVEGFAPQLLARANHLAELGTRDYPPKTKRRLNDLYARHCGRSYDEVERTLDRDHYMTAEEARAWGIVDKVCAGRA